MFLYWVAVRVSRLKGQGEAFRKEGHRVKNLFYEGLFCSLDTGDIQTGSRRRLARLQPFFKLFIATPPPTTHCCLKA